LAAAWSGGWRSSERPAGYLSLWRKRGQNLPGCALLCISWQWTGSGSPRETSDSARERTGARGPVVPRSVPGLQSLPKCELSPIRSNRSGANSSPSARGSTNASGGVLTSSLSYVMPYLRPVRCLRPCISVSSPFTRGDGAACRPHWRRAGSTRSD
jgi:hypothetical protein